MSEADEEDEGLVQIALQKRKVAALVAPTPKGAKTIQPALKHREPVIPSTIPRHIKTRATKANPKIGNEWTVSFTRNKEDPSSSSSDSESTDETPISPPSVPIPLF